MKDEVTHCIIQYDLCNSLSQLPVHVCTYLSKCSAFLCRCHRTVCSTVLTFQTLERMNDSVPKQAALAPSGDESLEQASLVASEVTQQMLAQKLELEDKKQSVSMLQKALVTSSLLVLSQPIYQLNSSEKYTKNTLTT